MRRFFSWVLPVLGVLPLWAAAPPASPDIVHLSPIAVGPYKYDAAGNITQIGTDRYLYDGMSRLVQGSAVTPQNADVQQFEYDGFGNLKKVVVPGKSTLYIDVDSSSNRLLPNPKHPEGPVSRV